MLRAMSVPGVPWSELLAYTGYPFVSVCFAVAAQHLGGARRGGALGSGLWASTGCVRVFRRSHLTHARMEAAAVRYPTIVDTNTNTNTAPNPTTRPPRARRVLRRVGLRQPLHGRVFSQDDEAGHFPGVEAVR